jgi:hypothetical protein
MKRSFVFFLFLVRLAIAEPAPSEAAAQKAIADTAIREAMEDFEAVANFAKPVHAKEEKLDVDVFDGGSTVWRGKGYSLEIRKRVSGIGSWRYFAYGPVVVFDFAVVRGDDEARTISYVRLFRADELLNKLKGK